METSCGVVLANGDLILLLRYPQGHWGFPKGHVEDDDFDHQATAIRELEEETGIIDVKIIGSWYATTSYTYSRRGSEREKQVHWFPARTNQMDVKLSEEHTDHIWIDVNDAENMITFAEEVEVLRDARKILRI
ncbi:MAG TPA: NUDIX domain-containing protein [Candidatus Thalassarchaeaceae archaeon]|jgi:8-oxo-dGTP pyrophosphatase MutT (NUDIX family)|nr:NUDIX domain-containing protein [Candidatus Thalassarchaeaceae archaeon]